MPHVLPSLGSKVSLLFKGLLALPITILIWISPVIAANKVSLTTYELNPYVGQNLTNNGATYEVVERALKEASLTTNIRFYPAIRSLALARKGEVAGTFPINYDSTLETEFIFSDPLPGIELGLLRKKHSETGNNVSVNNKTIGVIRGSFSDLVLDQFSGAEFRETTSNNQLLQMLMIDRVNYVLIDKYTAADLMVDQFPEMIGKLEFLNTTAKKIDFRVAFSKKHQGVQDIVSAFNQGLKKISENGELDKILYNHGLLTFKPESGKKVIRIATVANGDMITMQRLSAEFEKQNPGIVLDWRVIDESILRRRLLSDLAVSDGQYDVMTIGAYEAPIWAKKGWLLPLSDVPESYDVDDLIKPIRDSLSYKNQLFAVPFYGESSMMYYRTDLFEKAGIVAPKNISFENMLSYAKKIHAPEKGIYGVCLRGKAGWGENMAIIGTMVNSFGGQWFDMNWKAQINTPEWKKAISFYINLLSKYGPPDPHKNGYSENIALFSEGRCGMWVDATVAASTLFNPKKSKVHDKLGFAASPIAVTPKGSHWLWAWSLAIPKSSKLTEEGLKFVTWATSKAYINLVAESEGWIAVPPGTRQSTYNNDDYKAAAPFSNFVLAAIEGANPLDSTLKPSPYNGVQFVAIPEFPALGTQVGLYINQLLQGKMSLDEVLNKSQNFVDKKMDVAGYGK